MCEVGATRGENGGDIKWLRGSLVTLYYVRTRKDPGKPNDRLHTRNLIRRHASFQIQLPTNRVEHVKRTIGC